MRAKYILIIAYPSVYTYVTYLTGLAVKRTPGFFLGQAHPKLAYFRGKYAKSKIEKKLVCVLQPNPLDKLYMCIRKVMRWLEWIEKQIWATYRHSKTPKWGTKIVVESCILYTYFVCMSESQTGANYLADYDLNFYVDSTRKVCLGALKLLALP
jgi:hypothetical protein